MEENQNTNEEVVQSDDLIFDEADFPALDDGDHTENADENQSSGEDQGSEATKGADTPIEGAAEGVEANKGAAGELYNLDFLGETKQVNREEVVKLAQQGLNHDRMREQRDAMRGALQEQMNWRNQNEDNILALQQIAEASDMDVGSLIKSLKENLYVRQGMSRDAARERIEKESVQKKLDAKNQVEAQRTAQENAQRTRVQRETEEFAQLFPNVNVKDIPKEVFQQASSGKVSLTAAYISHLNGQLKAENKKLRSELSAHKKNNENKENAVGSARTEGKNTSFDDFLRGFNAE